MRPDYWNPTWFKQGQQVKYSGFDATVIRHYFDGMWEIRLPGGVSVVSGADIIA